MAGRVERDADAVMQEHLAVGDALNCGVLTNALAENFDAGLSGQVSL
jgi:hypothetical protein